MTAHDEAGPLSQRLSSVAVLGLGEVGCTFAQALSAAGLTVHGLEVRPEPSLEAWATENRIELHAEAGPWLRDLDLVISSVTGSAAKGAAGAAVTYLDAGTVYLDVNTTTPAVMVEVAGLLRPVGVPLVDGAIMGSLQLEGAQVPLLLAGEGAAPLAATLCNLGLHTRACSDRAGEASAIKMLRSVFMKGLEALAIECLTAAHQLDLREQATEALSDLDDRPISAVLEMLVTSHLRHAERRGKEVDEVQGLLRECGLPPVMTSAAGAVFARTLRHRAGNDVPSGGDLDGSLSWLVEATGSAPRRPDQHCEHSEEV